jgi:hypothetical protein
VETVGLATGFAILLALNPVAGDHEYKTPPVPLSWVLCPLQIVTLFPALAIIAGGFAIVAVPVTVFKQLPISLTSTV